MVESIGVAVTRRSSRVQNAERLTQVVRLGVTGSQAANIVNSPAMAIQDNGYSAYLAAL